MAKRKELKQLEVAYQNLEKLGPWGEDSIIYSLFHTEENFKKTTSKQFKSADCSPRKTYSKELPMMQTQNISPRKSGEAPPSDNKTQIPRTNVQDHFNRKPDRKLNTLTKKLTETKTISNFKSLPLLKVRRQLEIQRKIYVMSNRQVQSGQQARVRSISKSSSEKQSQLQQRRRSQGQPQPKKLQDINPASKTYFATHFNRMLKIIDEIGREDPIWATTRRPNDTNNM